MNLSKLNLTLGIVWMCVLAPLPAPGQDTDTNEVAAQAALQKQTEFLQQNFNKFAPYQFKKGTNAVGDLAASQFCEIQYFPVKTNLFEYQGKYYCGFLVTMPKWIDGDLRWIFLMAKNETNKTVVAHDIRLRYMSKHGSLFPTDYCEDRDLDDYYLLRKQFPYTKSLIYQSVDKDRFEPGQSYAICFRFRQTNVPDIAFAMTIDSDRGHKELGVLPLQAGRVGTTKQFDDFDR